MTDDLMAFLRQLPVGRVPNDRRSALEKLLALRWDDFHGADDCGMKPYKLLDRMEIAEWNPPVLNFTIERHGATVQGSSRAPLQQWSLNLDDMTADCEETGYRQLKALNPPLKVDPIAAEIAGAILGHEEHSHLDWLKNGGVRVRTTELLGGQAISKQTMGGRRKRFSKKVQSLLEPHGWIGSRGGVYKRDNELGDRPYPKSPTTDQSDR